MSESDSMPFCGPLISLMVSGKLFYASKANAEKSPVLKSMLEVGGDLELDMDPKSFAHVLSYLRGYPLECPSPSLRAKVCIDAKRLGLDELAEFCSQCSDPPCTLSQCPVLDKCPMKFKHASCSSQECPAMRSQCPVPDRCPMKFKYPSRECPAECSEPYQCSEPIQCPARCSFAKQSCFAEEPTTPLCACGETTDNCQCAAAKQPGTDWAAAKQPGTESRRAPQLKKMRKPMPKPSAAEEEPMPQLKEAEPKTRTRARITKPARAQMLSMPMPAAMPMRLRVQQELNQPNELSAMLSQMLGSGFYAE
jgi:hypothetical protein